MTTQPLFNAWSIESEVVVADAELHVGVTVQNMAHPL